MSRHTALLRQGRIVQSPRNVRRRTRPGEQCEPAPGFGGREHPVRSHIPPRGGVGGGKEVIKKDFFRIRGLDQDAFFVVVNSRQIFVHIDE